VPAETVRLPGGAKLNRKALLIAGAVGAGVVGYAYFTRRPQAIPEEVVTEGELDAVGDERIPTTGVPYDPTVPAPAGGLTDNAMWTQFARDQLTNQGYDGVAVSEALGKFLDRKPLSSSEANIARAAMAVAGEPPIGRPWNVLEAQTPASVGMNAPILTASAPVWRNGAWEYVISWAPVPGATRYWFQHVGGSSGYLTTTATTTIRAAAGRTDTWKFAGVNAANVKGPEATFAKMMPAAPAGTATTVPTAPKSVTATAIGRGKATIRWSGATGGPGSFYEIRATGGVWKRVNTTSYTTAAVWRAGTRLWFEVRTRNSRGTSSPRRSNTITIR
jgi:hypothetical protein